MSTGKLICIAMLIGFTPSIGLRAQDNPVVDNSLTKDLLSSSGPTFTVSPKDVPAHWSLIAYGDMRFTDPTNESVTNPFARRALVAKIAAEHPDALMLSGDVPYDGSNANDYAVFQTETAAWQEEHLRVYPALGNHELHNDEIRSPKNWWGAFPELKGRRWYSVEFANSYLIALDTNLSLADGSRQKAWLLDQFQHLPQQTRFVFISLHHPPVADSIEGNSSHDVRPNERALAVTLEAQAKNSNVQIIVVAGHIHNYQRFFQNGVTYLVSGGGGAKPHPIARTPADLFQDKAFPNYHYVRFEFDGKQLNAVMYRLVDPRSTPATWEKKDSFVIPVKP
jgi:3',5'-cyclic AMP phosphodiesterase CpdA